ncbi:MAG: hypothetical protein WBA01_18945 [Phormidesmis sp.]
MGRKLAHVTILTDTASDNATIAEIIQTVEALWYDT